MKASISSPVSSLNTPKTELCRVTQWAQAWSEHFRHNMEEQSLAETLGKDDCHNPLSALGDPENTKIDAIA